MKPWHENNGAAVCVGRVSNVADRNHTGVLAELLCGEQMASGGEFLLSLLHVLAFIYCT